MQLRARTRSLSILFVGVTISLMAIAPALAETRVTFQASKDDVKKACDNVEGSGGISVEGKDGKGYGCYNANNGVLVACSDNGACTGYIPKGAPSRKSLGSILNFGTKITTAPPASLSEGSSGGGGESKPDTGSGDGVILY